MANTPRAGGGEGWGAGFISVSDEPEPCFSFSPPDGSDAPSKLDVAGMPGKGEEFLGDKSLAVNSPAFSAARRQIPGWRRTVRRGEFVSKETFSQESGSGDARVR